MKNILVLFTFVLFVFSNAHASPKVGEIAPDFTGVDSNGKAHTVSEYKGKIVVLEWKNHLCPFVKKHYGSDNMQSLQKYAKEKDVVWFSIISSAKGKEGNVGAEEANKIVKNENSAAKAVILDEDGKIGKLYEAKTTPHMFVINKEGKIAYMGSIDDRPTADKEDIKTANNYVRVAIDALLLGNKPNTTVTSPYGCSIKY